MKLELNKENKQRFFAQYWGQEVGHMSDGHFEFPEQIKVEIGAGTIYRIGHIELKPLSSITDEDLKEVVRLAINKPVLSINETANCTTAVCNDTINIHEKHLVKVWHRTGNVSALFRRGNNYDIQKIHDQPGVIDFLRSRGYALPWMGISVEEMVKAGWVKLKEK